MKIKKLAILAIFTAIALIIHIIEAMIPLPLPIPGVKLGLANAVTLFMLFLPKRRAVSDAETTENTSGFAFKTVDVITVLFCRIILGALITGRMVAFLYSLAGGILAISTQIAAKRFVTEKQVWVCGAIGAAAHNIGQILAAMLITGTPGIAMYLPVLIVAGVITGVITGLIAGFAASRLKGRV